MNNSVGAFAVLTDAYQVVGEILADLLDERALVRVQLLVALAEGLQKFLQKFLRDLREVFDEVERVPHLMSNTRGEFAERRQFLAHDDLVLSPPQVSQHALELVVLPPQLFRQLFHEVQTLDLQGVATEYLQGRGHVGDLVVSSNLDLGLQVAASHSAHPARQPFEAA